jgi:hypothetical protein
MDRDFTMDEGGFALFGFISESRVTIKNGIYITRQHKSQDTLFFRFYCSGQVGKQATIIKLMYVTFYFCSRRASNIF